MDQKCRPDQSFKKSKNVICGCYCVLKIINCGSEDPDSIERATPATDSMMMVVHSFAAIFPIFLIFAFFFIHKLILPLGFNYFSWELKTTDFALVETKARGSQIREAILTFSPIRVNFISKELFRASISGILYG